MAAITLAIVLLGGFDMARGNRSMSYLRNAPCYSGPHPPKVSIIIPARNEAQKIAEALESVLQQDYPNLEFIVLNDRSTDNTAGILAGLAARDARLRVETISELPAGWLGKNYALYRGAGRASGELLLFTDADVVMDPTAVSRAVNYLQANRLDHLAAMPAVRMPTLPLRIFCSAFGVFFSAYMRQWKAKDPRSSRFIGVGAFNLVTRDAYRAIGTHQAIAMRPDDDVKLGKLLKKAGYRQELVLGMGMLVVEWYSSLPEMIDGLMKNSFAGIEYSVPLALASGIALFVLNVWPFIAIFVLKGAAWILYLLTVIFMLLFIADSDRFYDSPGWYALAHPLSTLLFVYIVWKSMFLTLWTGGIRWRGTHYPLQKLKSNRV